MSEPARTVFEDVESLAAHVGESLGRTDWKTVDQATIDLFADITSDHQWIHVDPERAAAGPFGTTIAHGFLTLSLCGRFLTDLLEVRRVGMVVNCGANRVRFTAPVLSGARVRAVGELISVEELAGGVQAVVRTVVEIEGGEKPACVADLVLRFYQE